MARYRFGKFSVPNNRSRSSGIKGPSAVSAKGKNNGLGKPNGRDGSNERGAPKEQKGADVHSKSGGQKGPELHSKSGGPKGHSTHGKCSGPKGPYGHSVAEPIGIDSVVAGPSRIVGTRSRINGFNGYNSSSDDEWDSHKYIQTNEDPKQLQRPPLHRRPKKNRIVSNKQYQVYYTASDLENQIGSDDESDYEFDFVPPTHKEILRRKAREAKKEQDALKANEIKKCEEAKREESKGETSKREDLPTVHGETPKRYAGHNGPLNPNEIRKREGVSTVRGETPKREASMARGETQKREASMARGETPKREASMARGETPKREASMARGETPKRDPIVRGETPKCDGGSVPTYRGEIPKRDGVPTYRDNAPKRDGGSVPTFRGESPIRYGGQYGPQNPNEFRRRDGGSVPTYRGEIPKNNDFERDPRNQQETQNRYGGQYVPQNPNEFRSREGAPMGRGETPKRHPGSAVPLHQNSVRMECLGHCVPVICGEAPGQCGGHYVTLIRGEAPRQCVCGCIPIIHGEAPRRAACDNNVPQNHRGIQNPMEQVLQNGGIHAQRRPNGIVRQQALDLADSPVRANTTHSVSGRMLPSIPPSKNTNPMPVQNQPTRIPFWRRGTGPQGSQIHQHLQYEVVNGVLQTSVVVMQPFSCTSRPRYIRGYLNSVVYLCHAPECLRSANHRWC